MVEENLVDGIYEEDEVAGKKRMIDEDIFRTDWMMDLTPQQTRVYFWVRLNSKHAGICEINTRIFNFEINIKNPFKVLDSISCIYKIGENKYFCPSALDDIYYNGFKKGSNSHDSAIEILKKHNLWDEENNTYIIPNPITAEDAGHQTSSSLKPAAKTSAVTSPSDEIPEEFLEAYKLYPGTKSRAQNFKVFKKAKDWKEALPKLKPAIQLEIKVKNDLKSKSQFCPEWKNFNTWLNKRCWEDEYEGYDINDTNSKDVIDLSFLEEHERWQYDRHLIVSGQERANQYLQRVKDLKNGIIEFG